MKEIKVLIADDKKHYIAYLMKICRQYSLSCVPETDPAAVLARIRNNEFFDILIIDVSFTQARASNCNVTITEPKVNGVKILETAKHQYLGNNFTPYIPVLCVAAGTKELYRFEQRAGLVFDFIERPFRDAEIKAVIEKAIRFLSDKREDVK